MPHEIAVFGILMPTLLPLFVLSMLLQIGLDWALGRLGVYEKVWHPALFRWCLLIVIFSGLSLPLYR
ncbi:DUF1656 domain-containing protein [Chromobacterium sphagni]|uniref:DUF1656 domain-containing protein n=1 Tax=Chromobacterium sphagni TaxID=1903179 RepID=A0A1S1WZ49_9NEIS|nr:DUF1656 domain-containing protein [Chromobacterium sphagni]OHX12419.1 hypothetical protein BI347_02095 [Chromobacterium sphagni]OHX21495.1 hypothetical protein BI344_02910 [Chromobacterium sphagni]